MASEFRFSHLTERRLIPAMINITHIGRAPLSSQCVGKGPNVNGWPELWAAAGHVGVHFALSGCLSITGPCVFCRPPASGEGRGQGETPHDEALRKAGKAPPPLTLPLKGGGEHPVPPPRWGEGINCGWGVKRLESVVAMGAGESEARPLTPPSYLYSPANGNTNM